jgi:hypothetical protein
MDDSVTIWVLYSDAPHGGYLFYGNPNPDIPSFHFGDLEGLLYGKRLVWENTKKSLKEHNIEEKWNHMFPLQKVVPKRITLIAKGS